MRQKLPAFAPRYRLARKQAKSLSDLAALLGVSVNTASKYGAELRRLGVVVAKFKCGPK